MTVANKPLERRAGRNIGIEPNLSAPFLQDTGGKEKILLTPVGSENVILECPEGMARTPLVAAPAAGIIVNNTAVDLNYTVFFRDLLGNEVPLTDIVTLAAGDVAPFEYHDGRLEETGFTLVPGEKIVLRSVAAPPIP